ncbi:MAG: urea transporter permease, partial [Pseudonocardiales bacterium]|nr:urea transporter permease [Pseudonocardiales bacterium]
MRAHRFRVGASGLTATLLITVLVLLPQVVSPYEISRLASSIAIAIAVLGLVVLTGWSGQISLGHGAFFGIGAYTSVILLTRAELPHLLTLVIAAVIGLGGGALAGLPALRVTGIYLALFSLALATVFPAFLQHFASVTGGSEGLSASTYTPFFPGISQDKWSYYLALGIAIPIFLLVHDFGRSRVG